MIDITDLRSTIVPKSDQLNAEQLLAGPMTITVTDVRTGSGDDQPVSIHYDNDNGRPYKPCKTMRKVLILAWGHDARSWIGKSMQLYNDPSVKFGGMDVGGIRISHMTDIPKNIDVSLTATKGKKAPHKIKMMDRPSDGAEQAIASAADVETLKATFGAAYKATKDAAQRARLKTAYDARMAALSAAPTFDESEFIKRIEACANLAALQLLNDEAEALPEGEPRYRVLAALMKRDGELAGG